MAAASYATNLTDITLAAATTGFTAIGGGGAITAETDFSIQDTTCLSKATAATWDTAGTPRGGVLYNNGAGITIPTDGAVLTWIYWWGPGVLANKASGGAEINYGNSTTAYYGQYVSGADDWQFGGWRCYPVDPGVTPRDRTVGAPNGTWQYFGWTANVGVANAIGKGNPYGIDAIRYGRCDLVCTNGDVTNGYATFLGAANWDNTSTRRLGLLIPRDGAYYWQGLLQLGSSGTAVDFRDSNRAIFVANTEKVTTNFNTIEVLNASSRVDWTSISITALGTVSKGRFVATANATITHTNCTFTDMGTFSYQGASNIITSTFRRCGAVTGGGANFDRCTFDSTTAASAVIVADLGKLDYCTFVSDGSSHAVELTTAGTYSWTCTGTGYDTGSTGSPVTPTNTGNEMIYVSASTGTVDISVATGATVPSIRSAGATVNVSAGSVTATLKVTTASGTAISGANTFVAASDGTGPLPYQDSVTIANSGTTATVTHTGHGMATNDKVHITGASHAANNGVFTITVTNANTYTYTMASSPGSNPTGTITATWVALYGTTDVNGEISVTRVFSSNQPVAGWARKSSGAPYYKTGPTSGIINTGTGATLTALLIADA